MKYTDFTKQYPVSKTLRFELKPIGETAEHLQKILEKDNHRAESYKKVKKIIDRYHQKFISDVLNKMELPTKDLLAYEEAYLNNRKDENKALESAQEALRKHIVKCFKSNELHKRLFGKELIEEDLLNFVESEEERVIVEEFKGFTTYFTGFNQNRENMYSDEKKHTAIAYRLINENLPKFLDNRAAFKKIVEVAEFKDQLKSVYEAFKDELWVNDVAAMFELNYFNKTITQQQIELYNAIIGGRSVDERTKLKGINELINLYNQQHKGSKLPKLKMLYKQILSDRDSLSFSVEAYSNDNQVLEDIRNFYDGVHNEILPGLKELLESIKEYDLSGVFLRNDPQITDISQHIFGAWRALEDTVIQQLKQLIPIKKKENEEKYQERIEKEYKSRKSFSIQELDVAIEIGKHTWADIKFHHIEDYFASIATDSEDTNIFDKIEKTYAEVQSTLLSQPYPDNKPLAQDKANVALIKNFLDALKELQRLIKPLLGSGEEPDKDHRFSSSFLALWNELDKITPFYNKVRNYLTQKPYSQEKLKLNFENSTLMDGWDQSKETANTTIILIKDGAYYLGIMNKQHNKLFEKDVPSIGNCYQKMVYKLLPGANKMLPKVFFSESRIKEFNPPKAVLDIRERGSYKGTDLVLKDCHSLIDFYKNAITQHEWNKEFDFHFSTTKDYENINQFFDEVEQQGYKISFQNVSTAYIDQCVKEGKLYLFQIYNKDFSPSSKGTPNLHTLYWKMLFDETNLRDVVYKLSGGAEVFYRKKSISYERPTHPAQEVIENKNPLNKKNKSLFDYDLIKDKRYTMDKFMLHVPVVMNFKSKGRDNINLSVREYLKSSADTHIIGIDRGERHLLYLVVIDSHGKIKEQFSLNEITTEYGTNENKNSITTDYHTLLDKKEDERHRSRRSWQTIENIKELKEGYLSQVVHQITNLMVKYKAIVVLEDLNMGFKRGRQKVEKSVYQKFEQMLIDKLNYLVDKKADPDAPGGLLHALQLTSKFESFEKLHTQSGFLFYVNAWNTSKMDPVTGFVNLFDTRYKNMEEAKSFFGKFDSIVYNPKEDRFEFKFDYNNFTEKADGTRTEWTLCAQGERIITTRDTKDSQWKSEIIRLETALKDLFNTYHIDLSSPLKDAIIKQTEAKFYERLLWLLKLTLQMRNSITGTETDYLVSPVCNDKGMFFDSRKAGDNLPKNADANGAYNIARKGLMLVRQLQNFSEAEIQKPKYEMTNKDYLRFVQNSRN